MVNEQHPGRRNFETNQHWEMVRTRRVWWDMLDLAGSSMKLKQRNLRTQRMKRSSDELGRVDLQPREPNKRIELLRKSALNRKGVGVCTET